MLKFREIEIEDIEILKRYLKKSNEISCENSFVNLLVWGKAYNNTIAEKDGILYIKTRENGKDTFRLPLGKDIEKGLKEIMNYCGNNLPEFWNPIGESFHKLPRWFEENYDFHENRDAFDYIYLRENLAFLKGKKYHGKRNHISKFSKTYNWHYERINKENLPKVLDCAKEWYKENVHRRDKYMECEQQGVELMLSNMERLELVGGAIFVEGEVAAFTIGSPINSAVFDIHIEKALSRFEGAYTVINREFALRELEEYKYINREDDMGLEGLRKAKLSYNPEIILKKYYCTPKRKNLNIKEDYIKIYRQAFGVDGKFEEALFSLCENEINFLEIDGKAVSFFFLLPCHIVSGDKEVNAKYLFAAVTQREERKKGYMERLIKTAEKKNNCPIILRPANKGLTDYYKKLGFKEFKAQDSNEDKVYIKPSDSFAELCKKVEITQDGQFTLLAKNIDFDLNGAYFPFSMP